MIARAATVRPWIFWQIAVKLGLAGIELNGKTLPTTPEEEGAEYFRAVGAYIDLILQYFGETDYGLQKARFFVATGSRWFLFGHSFWRITMKAKTLQQMKEDVAAYGERNAPKMYTRIEF